MLRLFAGLVGVTMVRVLPEVVTRKGEGSRIPVSLDSHGIRNTSGFVRYCFLDDHSFSVSAEKQNDTEYRGFNSSRNTRLGVDQERIEEVLPILGLNQISGLTCRLKLLIPMHDKNYFY